jgi:hypothetical protein
MEEQEQEAVEAVEPENTDQQPGAEPEGDEQAEQQPAEQPAPEPEASGFQKRINKVTADKYAYQRRAEAAEEALKKYSQPEKPSGKIPALEDFDYDEDQYQAALIDHRVNQRFQAAQTEQQQRKAQEKQAQAADAFAKKISTANVPDDYGEVIGRMAETVPLQTEVVSAIQQAENGPQLAYYLGQNLDVADSVARMSPVVAAMELGKISAQLSAGKQTKKPVTKAPNPVTPVKPGGATAKSIYDVKANVSMKEVMEADD